LCVDPKHPNFFSSSIIYIIQPSGYLASNYMYTKITRELNRYWAQATFIIEDHVLDLYHLPFF
jgi:hypothetical protein